MSWVDAKALTDTEPRARLHSKGQFAPPPDSAAIDFVWSLALFHRPSLMLCRHPALSPTLWAHLAEEEVLAESETPGVARKRETRRLDVLASGLGNFLHGDL